MSYKIQLRSLATIEVLEAYDWYESIKEGLGNDFLNQLELFYKTLQINPKAYSYYTEPVRQGRMNRFPYVVVYEFFEDKNSIVVYSVFMTKQDPIKRRIN